MERVSSKRQQCLPKALRVFAWNVEGRPTATQKRQIALNVIERGRAWHWRQLPPGWFDLAFCLRHGSKQTKLVLRQVFGDS